MFPEAQPSDHSQNIRYRFPEGSVNKGFIILSSVKVNDSIKQDKNCF